MPTEIRSIPRPLVRINQWFIVVSVVITWLTGVEWILTLPLLAGISGLLFGYNPVMRAASYFLLKHPSEYIPEDWEQQQFNQKIAVGCLTGGLISYAIGLTTIGHIFTVMVALAAFIAILGFCIGCFIRFQWSKYKSKKHASTS
jgi:predicted MFS family arabinose efflux permease